MKMEANRGKENGNREETEKGRGQRMQRNNERKRRSDKMRRERRRFVAVC